MSFKTQYLGQQQGLEKHDLVSNFLLPIWRKYMESPSVKIKNSSAALVLLTLQFPSFVPWHETRQNFPVSKHKMKIPARVYEPLFLSCRRASLSPLEFRVSKISKLLMFMLALKQVIMCDKIHSVMFLLRLQFSTDLEPWFAWKQHVVSKNYL